jgi:MFS transporter, DHA3 family, macrolide efflux protein
VSILAPLRHRPIALIWSGLALAATGDQLYAIALVWIAVRLLGENAGYLSALQAAAVLTAALFGGIWADRWDHRRTMIAADLCRAAAVLGFVALASLLPLSVAIIVPTALAVAALQAFFRPALQASLPRLAGDPRLLPAMNGLFDATERIARLIGPVIAGALSGIVPIIHFFTLDALTFLASAWAVSRLGSVLKRLPEAAVSADRGVARIGRSLARGFVALRAQPMIAYSIWSSGVLNGLWFVTMFLAVPLLIVRRDLGFAGGTSFGAYAAVMASYGVTNLATNLVIGSRTLPRRPARLIYAGNVVLGLGLTGMAVAAWLAPNNMLLAALMAAAGFAAIGGPMQDIPLATLRQTLFAAGDIAAVMRLSMVATQAGLLIGMLAAPPLLAAFGMPMIVFGCGAGIVAIGALGLALFGRSEERTDGDLARPIAERAGE